MAQWTDRYFENRDGLRLHYRDYPGPSDRPTVLCLHGLTRNSRDFDFIAGHLAGDWRVLTHDFRGRGKSQWDAKADRYAPRVYADDVIELLDHVGIDEAVFLGTSLGGLVTMLVASIRPALVAGAMLNDIGPEVDPRGIDRIRTYVGRPLHFADYASAAEVFQSTYGDVHPSYGPAEWERYARRVCTERDGQVCLDYDMRIADNFNRQNEDPVGDLWPLVDNLANKPVLLLRGETSDLLSRETASRLATEIGARVVTVPGVGHAPDLEEPESVAAIEDLLGRVVDRAGAGAAG